ncbi:helix-turn-helix transcriptional regulator [Flavobacteriaceae bacterium 3-367]|uniref:helix-turn-helix domain-containing protein n=1 Tax=Eudoraea algarum TaxID=3417568 RepID=UPI0032762AD0
MVNSSDFIERLEKIMGYYGLSASAFADKIRVQRSSISHLLTGRNKPSLEFVMKVIKTFPEVNLYWLLNGKGGFPASSKPDSPTPKVVDSIHEGTVAGARTIKKIVIFYDDGSFESYETKK